MSEQEKIVDRVHQIMCVVENLGQELQETRQDRDDARARAALWKRAARDYRWRLHSVLHRGDRLAMANRRQAAEIARLREALDGMLDWALSNRGTKYEFVTCRSGATVQDYPALQFAITALQETADD